MKITRWFRRAKERPIRLKLQKGKNDLDGLHEACCRQIRPALAVCLNSRVLSVYCVWTNCFQIQKPLNFRSLAISDERTL